MTATLAAELALRVLATAGIVIAVAWAVERFGPAIGGALGGLPIVLGPGFFFILRENSVGFAVDAATSALIALTASQVFLLVYVIGARRSRAILALAALSWFAAAVPLAAVPRMAWVGLALFAAATLFARRVTQRLEQPRPPARGAGGWGVLLLRGGLAGALVAAVTLVTERLGPALSGLLLTYPLGLSVISITIHQRVGADIAISTLRAAMLGISSLAAFCFVLAIGLPHLGAALAFALAAVAGIGVTSGLARLAATRG
ncbi:hypothetical protein E2L08_10270 [Palleronia sediminis]|uniref:Uncharacterized protein n=1 Tax=Palleronia sediminis TaxID=2547833 RepID=A0A4R6AAP8_9RHOB|nr:hypothetical protein [Palleronia sediminis]TDL79398.1 hypothetical protein E2L08_10270 [Palleronia sediminis]